MESRLSIGVFPYSDIGNLPYALSCSMNPSLTAHTAASVRLSTNNLPGILLARSRRSALALIRELERRSRFLEVFFKLYLLDSSCIVASKASDTAFGSIPSASSRTSVRPRAPINQ